MYGQWLKPRKGFEFLLDYNYDINNTINKLKEYVENNKFLFCAFPGHYDHWMESIRYSIKGEIGFTLWGDTGSGNKGTDKETGIEFKSLIEKYRNQFLNKNGESNEIKLEKPLFSLFYVTEGSSKNNYGYIGFGIVTDINYDYYRNFIGWKEENGYFKIRFRIKVLYLNSKTIKDIKEHIDKNEDFKKINLYGELGSDLKLIPISNTCYNEYNNQVKDYIKEKFDNQEVKNTLTFYQDLYNKAINKSLYSSFSENPSISQQNESLINEIEEEKIKEIENNLKEILNLIEISEIGKSNEDKLNMLINSIKKGNLLFVGDPGTFKTTIAKDLAKIITKRNEVSIYTANSLWFRRNVIGGETLSSDGKIFWKSGILIRAYNKASEIINSNDRYHVVIIDEINRADIDKAFGEFLTIINSPLPENWEITRELIEEIRNYYEKDEEAEKFLTNYEKFKNDPLKKIRFIATMNLTDVRNLFYVGEAITRRFIRFDFKPKALDNIVDNYSKNNKDCIDKDKIKNLLNCFEKNKNKDKKIPIPLSSVLDSLKLSDCNYDKFIAYLLSTIGTINSSKINFIKNKIEECQKGP
ncbi:ATPase family protein associated with various cellular activities (AAA) [Caldisphaera lagunensis DSM 15908]|uniref:ATPase family protein associated with various cellular activities (AAA) n=1 Tax=Caldisphaera lagunensis (strain DSM 15908 / JCM 11604 / ANMR 0165 / IC-154) TaxID=1056495 RepID=L0AA35_CALLD|nr:AAA family ATPase [Caldisphaera lagunensis]AFZ70284.1 ATPase family protein associated with various cellular activities (AAA) [Caldisphaera lagunensis DSM 15908]